MREKKLSTEGVSVSRSSTGSVTWQPLIALQNAKHTRVGSAKKKKKKRKKDRLTIAATRDQNVVRKTRSIIILNKIAVPHLFAFQTVDTPRKLFTDANMPTYIVRIITVKKAFLFVATMPRRLALAKWPLLKFSTPEK